jgi:hypothetical protein
MQGKNAECVRVSSFFNCRLIAATVEWLGRSLPPGQTYPMSKAIVIALTATEYPPSRLEFQPLIGTIYGMGDRLQATPKAPPQGQSSANRIL